MNRTFTIKSDMREGCGNRMMRNHSEKQVKDEPMFFKADLNFALAYGGPLTQDFINCLDDDWIGEDLIIDSRVHMLMPGWWPCIPGWHHDDVPREREDGQPEYGNPSYKSEQVLAFIGDVAPTEFALGTAPFLESPLGQNIYGKWTKDVDYKLGTDLTHVVAKPNLLYYFDWNTWHRGACSEGSGWRWFMRATRKTNLKPANEIRRQTQVYLDNPEQGW